MAEYIYYWNKIKHYSLIILPMFIVGIIFLYIARSISEGFLDFIVIFVKEKMRIILFITLLLAVVIALLLTQATKIAMRHMESRREELKEKSKIRKMRLGVNRE